MKKQSPPVYRNARQTREEPTSLMDDPPIGDKVTGYGEGQTRSRKKRNPWFIAAMVLLALLVGLSAYVALGLSGRLRSSGIRQETIETEEAGEVSVTSFRDPVSMEILLSTLRTEYVYICGNQIVSDASVIQRNNGVWSVNGETIDRGEIRYLTYFKDMTVRQMVLVNENVGDLKGIESMQTLSYLDLSDNPLRDLSPIAELRELHTLLILDMPEETDLSPLTASGSLRQVYVSPDMMDRIGPLLEAGIDVTVRK